MMEGFLIGAPVGALGEAAFGALVGSLVTEWERAWPPDEPAVGGNVRWRVHLGRPTGLRVDGPPPVGLVGMASGLGGRRRLQPPAAHRLPYGAPGGGPHQRSSLGRPHLPWMAAGWRVAGGGTRLGSQGRYEHYLHLPDDLSTLTLSLAFWG